MACAFHNAEGSYEHLNYGQSYYHTLPAMAMAMDLMVQY